MGKWDMLMELSKRIAAATTMSQEEAAYHLSHKLMEGAQTGRELEDINLLGGNSLFHE